jgi:hypothetical protein
MQNVDLYAKVQVIVMQQLQQQARRMKAAL